MNEIEIKDNSAKISSFELFEKLGYTEHRLLKRVIKSNKELFSADLFLNYTFSAGDIGRGRSNKSYLLGFADLLTLISISKNNNGNSNVKASVIKKLIQSVESAGIISIVNIIKDIDVEDLPPDRFVYVAKEEKSGRYKIGISKNPEERIKELNTGNPEQLTLVHAYLATEQKYLSETLAHSLFEDNRLKGEWFKETINLDLLPSYTGTAQ